MEAISKSSQIKIKDPVNCVSIKNERLNAKVLYWQSRELERGWRHLRVGSNCGRNVVRHGDFMVTSTSLPRTVHPTYLWTPTHLSLISPPTVSASYALFLLLLQPHNTKRERMRETDRPRGTIGLSSLSDVMVPQQSLVPASGNCWNRKQTADSGANAVNTKKKRGKKETRQETRGNETSSRSVSNVCPRSIILGIWLRSPSSFFKLRPRWYNMEQTRNYIFTPFW